MGIGRTHPLGIRVLHFATPNCCWYLTIVNDCISATDTISWSSFHLYYILVMVFQVFNISTVILV